MKNRMLRDSFRNAFRGLYQAFKTERNIKLHCLSTIAAFALAIYLKFNLFEWAVLVLTITSVFVAELLNTAIEYTVDMVCGKSYHELAKYAKDIAAGATLVSALGAGCVGLFLYLPKFMALWF